jgi:O-antigen ligase
MATAVVLISWANSKTALGLAIVAPLLAALTLIIRRLARISPAIILLALPICYVILSNISNFNINRISYILYGDSTLTGRTIIWDFSLSENARRPLLDGDTNRFASWAPTRSVSLMLRAGSS